MTRKLFGTDGIRGKANIAPMDSDTVIRLARAAAHVMRRSEGRHRILIGKDTRVSGYMIETALASGITSMGVDVLLVGPLPTPGVAFMTRSMRADAGVMISASHNSYEDNGIKFFGPDGFKLADEIETEIEELIQPGRLDELRASPELIGKAFRIDDAVGRYTVYLKSCVERECEFEGLRIALDTGNGAAYKVAPQVFEELGAEIITTGDKPDGKNINLNCRSTNPETVAELVKATRADLGVCFDGDADRAIFCDEKGNIVDGDLLLAILTQDMVRRGVLRGDGIVATVMSNMGLELFLKELKLKLYRSKVGDRYVLQEMIEKDLNLGGEQSGHIIHKDHNTTGDGILSALLLVSTLIREGKKLSEYQNLIKRFPQHLVNLEVNEKIPFDQNENIMESVKAAEDKLGTTGRLLLRYSGTENKARVMVECESEVVLHEVISDVTETLAKELA